MVRTFHKPGRGTAGLITLSILAFLGRMVFDFGVKNQLYILGLAIPPGSFAQWLAGCIHTCAGR